jgi:hypothetical protein
MDLEVGTMDDGNWDDSIMEEEELGFTQGPAMQIGGVADMEDEVHLEFDEDEDEVQPPLREPKTWKLMARYMANLNPNV